MIQISFTVVESLATTSTAEWTVKVGLLWADLLVSGITPFQVKALFTIGAMVLVGFSRLCLTPLLMLEQLYFRVESSLAKSAPMLRRVCLAYFLVLRMMPFSPESFVTLLTTKVRRFSTAKLEVKYHVSSRGKGLLALWAFRPLFSGQCAVTSEIIFSNYIVFEFWKIH